MEKDSRIIITGSTGLVGQALISSLRANGYNNLIEINTKNCDLTNDEKTLEFFLANGGDYVFHLAALVYGIMGNMKNKAISFLDNIRINTNVIEASYQIGVKKITAMGSGCVYPYPSPGLPLIESMIWQGKPHEAEDSYAQAKRAMYAQLMAYRESYNMKYAFVVSGNLYGPGDKFEKEFGHVVPSLVRKFYEAFQSGSRVSVWGNGSARRDFMYSEDMAEALIKVMMVVEGPVNVGSGTVSSIKEIVNHLADFLNMNDRIDWDPKKPNGQDYREYDLSLLRETGFDAPNSLKDGLNKTLQWFIKNEKIARK